MIKQQKQTDKPQILTAYLEAVVEGEMIADDSQLL